MFLEFILSLKRSHIKILIFLETLDFQIHLKGAGFDGGKVEPVKFTG
jgi:hypothetical protein